MAFSTAATSRTFNNHYRKVNMKNKADLIAEIQAVLHGNGKSNGQSETTPAPKQAVSRGIPVTAPITAAAPKTPGPFSRVKQSAKAVVEEDETEETEAEVDTGVAVDYELVDDLESLVNFVVEKQHSLRELIQHLRNNEQ